MFNLFKNKKIEKNIPQYKNVDLYKEIVDYTLENREVSISLLQRKFKLKFLDAESYIRRMEEEKIVVREKTGLYTINKNYTDLIDVDNLSEEFLQEITDKTFQVDHLKNEDREQILADDRTLEQTIKDSYKNAIRGQQQSKNPKFHRTHHEQDLSFQFYQSNLEKLKIYEKKIYDLDEEVEKQRKNKKDKPNLTKEEILDLCQREFDAYNDLRKYCYSKGKGGMLYFQNTWEYCHYNWDDCFPFIQKSIDYYNKVKNRSFDTKK